jgi:hypothetical protein
MLGTRFCCDFTVGPSCCASPTSRRAVLDSKCDSRGVSASGSVACPASLIKIKSNFPNFRICSDPHVASVVKTVSASVIDANAERWSEECEIVLLSFSSSSFVDISCAQSKERATA